MYVNVCEMAVKGLLNISQNYMLYLNWVEFFKDVVFLSGIHREVPSNMSWTS